MLGLCRAHVGSMLALCWAASGPCWAMLGPCCPFWAHSGAQVWRLADFTTFSKVEQPTILEQNCPPSESLIAIAIASGSRVPTKNASASLVRADLALYISCLKLSWNHGFCKVGGTKYCEYQQKRIYWDYVLPMLVEFPMEGCPAWTGLTMVLRIALVDEQVELFGLGDEAFLVECQRLHKDLWQFVNRVFTVFDVFVNAVPWFQCYLMQFPSTWIEHPRSLVKHISNSHDLSVAVPCRSFPDDDLDLYWQPMKLRHGGFIPLGEARLLDHPALESSQSAKDLATFDKHSGTIHLYSIHYSCSCAWHNCWSSVYIYICIIYI